MPYTPTTWVNDTGVGDGTVVNAARMNNIESGVANAVPADVTALPASPTDGQTVDLLADGAAAYGGPYLWRVKYRAATPGTAKWHVLSAVPLRALGNGGAQFNSNNVFQTANIPSITIAVAGDYDVEWGGWAQNWSTPQTQSVEFGVFVAGVEVTVAPGNPGDPRALYANESGAYGGVNVKGNARRTIASGAAIDVRYRNTGTAVVYATNIHLLLRPVRIGP
jgi:hypothetical protein